MLISEENLKKQTFNGLSKSLNLYGDNELEKSSENIFDIYKSSLENNFTVIRCCHKALGNMGEVTILDDYNVDIYIPSNPSMSDIKIIEMILSDYENSSLTITNIHDNDYDFYDYNYNYFYNHKSPYEICEYYYKEKNSILDDNLKEMFVKYRNFSMPNLVCDDYSDYPINNRNTGIVIIMPDLVIKKTITKNFHKRECLAILRKFYQINNDPSYIDIVSDYNLVIGIITKDTISAYVSANINDYQLEELSSFIKETYDIKSLKPDLITSANIIENKKEVFWGELSYVSTWFALKDEKKL